MPAALPFAQPAAQPPAPPAVDRLNALMREAATRARACDCVFEAVDRAVMAAIGAHGDPVTAARVRRANRVNLEQWLSRTIMEPGRIPSYQPTPDMLRAARENARAGQGEIALAAFQAGQAAAWELWSDVVFDLTDDPAELRALLDASHRSITSFVAEAAAAMRAENARGLADISEGSPERRREYVARLLEGRPTSPGEAGRRLGYRLDQGHQALILWGASHDAAPSALDRLAQEIAARCAGGGAALTIIDDSIRRWVWLPVRKGVSVDALEALRPPGLRIALGPPGAGLDGFRRSHQGAQEAQRALALAPGRDGIARYEDIRLPALLMRDAARARRFAAEVLGPLETGPPQLRDTLRAYLAAGENVARAAEALKLHRNTVMRRLAQIEERLPRPAAENRAELAAALELLRWLPKAER